MLVHFDSQFTFYTNLHTSRFVLCYNKKSCLQKNTQFNIRLSTHINTFITQPNLQQKTKLSLNPIHFISSHIHTQTKQKKLRQTIFLLFILSCVPGYYIIQKLSRANYTHATPDLYLFL